MSATTMVEPFRYDAASARLEYEIQGWYHAAGGVSDEMMRLVTEQVAELMGSDEHELANWRYPEKKEQFLWELPEHLSIETLCRAVAETTGMDPESTVLSERHLKVYSDRAPEMPPPHKDRSASTVTVGIGIDIPADSRLVLWPETHTEFNPFPTAAQWRETRHPEELPEVVTCGVEPAEIDLRRGDVVLFRGANLYHERHRPARTSVLYLKFNDRGLDPLGEDPRTVLAEERSKELERGEMWATHVAAASPRLISVCSEQLFPDLGTVETARTFGSERGQRLTADEAALLRVLATEGPRVVAELPAGPSTLERLVRCGLILLS